MTKMSTPLDKNQDLRIPNQTNDKISHISNDNKRGKYLTGSRFISKSEKETMKIASRLAKKLQGGEIIGLIGNLGTGKTVFIRGLAKAFGIKKPITSPTFVLLKQYKARINADVDADQRGLISDNQRGNLRKSALRWLVHVDAYRLKSAQDLIEIGVKDWLGKKDTITVIEWANRVKKILPKKAIKIWIKLGGEENERVITTTNYEKFTCPPIASKFY